MIPDRLVDLHAHSSVSGGLELPDLAQAGVDRHLDRSGRTAADCGGALEMLARFAIDPDRLFRGKN